MSKQLTFEQTMEKHLQTLKLYVPVVSRVHGSAHPEFHQVHEVFEMINKKVEGSGLKKAELKEEFAKLKEITNNYTIPEDVCESYQAVYQMLAELNQAYNV